MNDLLSDPAPPAATQLIAVVGGSGSGKSWLADRIRAAYGEDAGHLSLDDFYRDLSHLSEAERDGVNFDDPGAIDWEALRAVLDSLSAGQAAALPSYDFATHTRRKETVDFPHRPVVILEGLWLLHPEWLRGRFTHSLFVECGEGLRLQRRIDRDMASRGRTEESVRRQFEDHVQPMHALYVEPQRAWAGYEVNSPAAEEEISELLERWRSEG